MSGRATRAGRSLSIVIADAEPARLGWLQDSLRPLGDVHLVAAGSELLDRVDDRIRAGAAGPYVLIVGERCTDMARGEVLAALATRSEELERDNASVFLCARNNRRLQLADVPEELPIQYTLDERISADDIRALIERAVELRSGDEATFEDRQAAARMTQILDVARAVSRLGDLTEVTDALRAAVADVTGAERSYCLFHDSERGILWSESSGDERADDMGAFVGLSGFAARTGEPVYAPIARDDPRYLPAVDDPDGSGAESIIAQPIADRDGNVHVVLVAVRASSPFDHGHRRLLVELATHTSGHIHQLALRTEAEAILSVDREEMFRQEAIDAYVTRGRSGDVVRVSPPWVRSAYWLLLVLLAAGAVYLIVGRVDEYSVGPSVVRMSGRSEVTAHVAGTVSSVAVSAGQRVRAGEVLVRLYDADEKAELDRVKEDLDAQLRARMLDPGDVATRQAVSSLRAQWQRARARLEERTVRAPRAGTVVDIRARESQHVSPGELIAALVDDDPQLSVIAFLPGADRPKLHPGMSLRMELAGYRYAYQDLVIDKVSDEIIGPAEARRYLGPRLADGIPVVGSVVIVEAKLPARHFEAHGERYPYYDGMLGRAEIRTRDRRIIVALIPPLEEL